MEKNIRWGIAGTGNIAKVFVEDLRLSEEVEIVGVSSRSVENAKQFAKKYDIPKWYNSYIDMAQDSNIDIVYIATPHALHYEHSYLFMNYDKGVLCEKPFTVNAEEAAKLMDEARKFQKILMEGMWTRFQPAVIKLNSLLNEKRIGEIKLIHGSFCFSADYDPAHRLFDLELGGGALLDVGIYPISLMIMILGRPSKIHSFVHIGDSGVDESASVIFQFDGNVSSTLNFSIRSAAPNEFVVMGTDGYIKLHSPIYRPDKMTVSDKYGNEELLEFDIRGKGFIYEIEEVNRCFREGLAESPVMQHRESYRIMKVLDTIRKQWMLSYPND